MADRRGAPRRCWSATQYYSRPARSNKQGQAKIDEVASGTDTSFTTHMPDNVQGRKAWRQVSKAIVEVSIQRAKGEELQGRTDCLASHLSPVTAS